MRKNLFITAALSLSVFLTANAQLGDNGFYRVQNNATGRYVGIIHDRSETEVVTTQADLNALRAYKNWDWVYGKSPAFTIKKRHHFTSGTIDARMLIEKGKIVNVKIYVDFFVTGDVHDIENELQGLKYDPQTLRQALNRFDLNKYFMGIDPADVVNLIAEQH